MRHLAECQQHYDYPSQVLVHTHTVGLGLHVQFENTSPWTKNYILEMCLKLAQSPNVDHTRPSHFEELNSSRAPITLLNNISGA